MTMSNLGCCKKIYSFQCNKWKVELYENLLRIENPFFFFASKNDSAYMSRSMQEKMPKTEARACFKKILK